MSTESRQRDKLRGLLLDKLHREGWDSIRQFTIRSRVPFSPETTRRAFMESEKPLEPATVAIIMKYLGFSHEEIKNVLVEYADVLHPDWARAIAGLIGRQEIKISVCDQAVIKAMEALAEVNPGALRSLADHLDLLAAAAGVELKEHTDKLRRKR